MYERPQIKKFTERILEQRRFIQVIFGPRQVGKTTLANQLVKKLPFPCLYETADAIPARTGLGESKVKKKATKRS